MKCNYLGTCCGRAIIQFVDNDPPSYDQKEKHNKMLRALQIMFKENLDRIIKDKELCEGIQTRSFEDLFKLCSMSYM